MDKEKALLNLYDLIDFYYENRDLPVKNDFNFFEELKVNCEVLELDVDKVREIFNI